MSVKSSMANGRARMGAAVLGLALASGCATAPKLSTATTEPPQRDSETRAPVELAKTAVELLDPSVKTAPEVKLAEATAEEIAALFPEEREIEASLPPQPLPQFIDTVFGDLLETSYFVGPGVAARRETVFLRGAGSISNREFFGLVQSALKDYGLRVAIQNGAVRVFEDAALGSSATARIVRGRSAPDMPASSRYMVQFFPLKAVDAAAVIEILQDSYPNRGSVRFRAQADTNTIVISGAARDVSAAAAVISQIDEPRFGSGLIARIQPVFWSAERLADAVARALVAEGFQVTIGDGAPPRAIAFLPVPFTNDVLVFSSEADVFQRALYWAQELDTASSLGDQTTAFVYNVRNTSAAELGELLSQVALEEAPAGGANAARQTQRRPTPARPTPTPQGQRVTETATPAASGRITVDAGGNRLIFRGTPSEFERLRTLMEELDTPPQQVLVELTIAEVTLTDETKFGVEWFVEDTFNNGNGIITGDTRGSATRDPGGLGLSLTRIFSTSSVRATLTALAENRNINVLSTPRLLARSGGEAEILVGAEVPIITSQRAADNQTGGSSDILQTVQYRQTGVILNMRPVIYGDRVDIEIFQEVSGQEPNRTSDIASPVITNRSVTTQLSLREGYTAVIGGLIQDNYSREQRGVPLLKDVPLVGSLFRTDAVSGGKTELLVLVTPYIVSNDGELREAAEAYSDQINRTLRKRGPQTYTLLPWRRPFKRADVHGATPFRSEAPQTGQPAEPPAAAEDGGLAP